MGAIAQAIVGQLRRELSAARRKARESLRQKSRTRWGEVVTLYGWTSNGAPRFAQWTSWDAPYIEVGLIVVMRTRGIRAAVRLARAAGIPPSTVTGCALVARRLTQSCNGFFLLSY